MIEAFYSIFFLNLEYLTVNSHLRTFFSNLTGILLEKVFYQDKKEQKGSFLDFADVRAVMKDAGTALMGVGTGEGRNRASDAAVAAISSPLLDFPIQKAKRVVFNIVGGF